MLYQAAICISLQIIGLGMIFFGKQQGSESVVEATEEATQEASPLEEEERKVDGLDSQIHILRVRGGRRMS